MIPTRTKLQVERRTSIKEELVYIRAKVAEWNEWILCGYGPNDEEETQWYMMFSDQDDYREEAPPVRILWHVDNPYFTAWPERYPDENDQGIHLWSPKDVAEYVIGHFTEHFRRIGVDPR